MSFAELESTIIRSLVFPIWAARDHPQYRRYYREFEKSQFLSKNDLRELQRKHIQKLLTHANLHCPFYRQRFESANVKPSDFEDIDCLLAIPPVTKKDIQENMIAMCADNVPEIERLRNQTGGSTGSPVQFYVDKERFGSRMASTDRHNLWAGYRPGDWCACLWGARLDLITSATLWNKLRNHLLYRRIELNTSNIGENDWRVFIEDIRRKKPKIMLAYAQSAVLFAKYLLEHRIEDIRFSSIITTSEILFPEQREMLEETFRAKVFNRYGSREVSVLASECEHHTGLHVNADALFVEVQFDPSIPAPDGKLLITDMLNRSMPLIRYEIGDAGRWSDSQDCPCGRGLPLLADIQGRLTDFLVMPDGRHVSGVALLTLVFADVRGLEHVQLIQDSYQHIRLCIVPGKEYDPSTEQLLRDRLKNYVDATVQISVELCSEIELASSGKRRFVINQIPANQATNIRKV